MQLHKLVCPNCGGNIEMKLTDSQSVFCPYCGQQFLMDDGKKEVTINKNINIHQQSTHTKRIIDEAELAKAHNQRHALTDNKLILMIILIWFAAAFLILGIDSIRDLVAKSEGKVSVGSYQNLEGEDYETVVAHFESAGFENIRLVDLNDSGVMFWQEGKVEKISVGGNSTFASSDYFDINSEVVISYH